MLEKFLKKVWKPSVKPGVIHQTGRFYTGLCTVKWESRAKKALCRDRQGAEESAMGSDYVREGW